MKSFVLKLVFGLGFLFQFSSAHAKFIDDKDIVMSEMSLGPAQISESDFNQIIQKIQSAFTADVARFGGNLAIKGDWKNEKPNAYANQLFGAWNIQITGGLARRPELTTDGMSLILCHEMGHHLGGFAYIKQVNPIQAKGIAAEGQADYFATQHCSRVIWGSESQENAAFRKTASTEILDSCNSVWTDTPSQDLCYRTLVATESVIKTMAGIKNKPMAHFSTPDQSQVTTTFTDHPDTQCRMDTSYQGALCAAAFNPNIIPGKTVASGPFSADAEKEAAAVSCTHYSNYKIGLRPACWFKAQY